jgi:hypothetical protein
MNELKNMCTQVRPPEPRTLAEGRRRLTAAARGEKRTHARRPRTAWTVGIATATGVAVAAGVVAVASTGNGPTHTGGPTGGASGPVGEVRLVSATQVLDFAATAARQQPDLNPGAGQFIHIRSMDGRVGRELWLSVDGRKDGVLRRSPCFDGKKPQCDISLGRTPSDFTPAYYRTLPTDPVALAAWFRREAPGKRPLDQRMWKDIQDRIFEQYLPPKLAAAMFTVAAKIPGVHLVKGVKDPAGRDGVGVSKTIDGVQQQLIFDRRTFRFLGTRQITAAKPAGDWGFVLLGVSVADSAPVVQGDPLGKQPLPSKAPG